MPSDQEKQFNIKRFEKTDKIFTKTEASKVKVVKNNQ